MTKILITGITSIHGWPVYQRFCRAYPGKVYGIYPVKMARYFVGEDNTSACDIEDRGQLEKIFNEASPSAVVHAAGVCDLDMCEDAPDFAYEVNAGGARNIAELAGDRYVLYISSDLVFSGNWPAQEGYSPEHQPDPVSVVGKTYLSAEKEISKLPFFCIARIGLPIGPSISGTKGAVDFIAGRLEAQRKMTLFYDEVRSLISTEDLAESILRLFRNRAQGIVHCASSAEYSLYDIGKYITDSRGYRQDCLIKSSRFDEENGPPRIGRVALDCKEFFRISGFTPCDPLI